MPVCGLFRGQRLRFSRFNACFRHLVWHLGVLRAALSRFSAPLFGQRSPLRIRSSRGGGKGAPIFHLSTICFPPSFPQCGENVHHPVRFPPPFRFSSAGRTDPLPPKARKVSSRARIYNIGAKKGEKGSAPFAAFRGGRGLLGARGGRAVAPPRGERPHGRAGFAERSGGACRQWGVRVGYRGGVRESGRAGTLRLHPSRNGRRGTGAPRSLRLHNSRSILSIVSEWYVQIMIYVGRSNKFLHNFSTVLYISPVKISPAHRFFVRCAENLCFTLFFCPAVVKKHPETPQGSG